jgi:hypothetical protein
MTTSGPPAALTPLGLRVILAEYPGYGPRPSTLSERSMVPDAAETIALARTRGTTTAEHGRALVRSCVPEDNNSWTRRPKAI